MPEAVTATDVMLQNDLVLQPVMNDRRRLAELVSIADIFEGIAGGVLKK